MLFRYYFFNILFSKHFFTVYNFLKINTFEQVKLVYISFVEMYVPIKLVLSLYCKSYSNSVTAARSGTFVQGPTVLSSLLSSLTKNIHMTTL